MSYVAPGSRNEQCILLRHDAHAINTSRITYRCIPHARGLMHITQTLHHHSHPIAPYHDQLWSSATCCLSRQSTPSVIFAHTPPPDNVNALDNICQLLHMPRPTPPCQVAWCHGAPRRIMPSHLVVCYVAGRSHTLVCHDKSVVYAVPLSLRFPRPVYPQLPSLLYLIPPHALRFNDPMHQVHGRSALSSVLLAQSLADSDGMPCGVLWRLEAMDCKERNPSETCIGLSLRPPSKDLNFRRSLPRADSLSAPPHLVSPLGLTTACCDVIHIVSIVICITLCYSIVCYSILCCTIVVWYIIVYHSMGCYIVIYYVMAYHAILIYIYIYHIICIAGFFALYGRL